MDTIGTRVIAVGNQKGGVGKTTNTVHIARALVERGRKVLIIDLDMNHGATRHFGVVPEAFMGSYEMLVGDEQAAHLVLTDQDEDVSLPQNLHLIPAARKLEGIDQALAQKSKFITPREVLIRPLESLRGQYDYIFLDTAPNATTPTIASYLAADYFILSAMPDPFAIAGLNDALTDIGDAQKRDNPKLGLLGVLFTREETHALDRLVNQLAVRLRTPVKASHLLRAVTSLLLSAEAQIDHRAEERGGLTRPPNDDFGALQRFEREAQILAHALRDAGPPR